MGNNTATSNHDNINDFNFCFIISKFHLQMYNKIDDVYE